MQKVSFHPLVARKILSLLIFAISLASIFNLTAEAYVDAEVIIRVVDTQTGLVIPGAQVRVSGPGTSASAVTNQNGEARFNRVRVESGHTYETVSVACSASGYESKSVTIEVKNQTFPQDFTVFLAKTTVTPSPQPLTPEHTVTVWGKVYDSATNEPVVMAGVTITGDRFSRSDTTNRDGKYSIDGCPSDRVLTITASAVGYRGYSAALPLLGSITDYRHDIPLDKLFTIPTTAPDEPLTPLEPAKPRKYGADPSKYEPRETPAEPRKMASTAGGLKSPIIADISGGICARIGLSAVALFARDGAAQWTYPEDIGNSIFTLEANDISDDGSYIAAAGNYVIKIGSNGEPVWSYAKTFVCDCVAISGDGTCIAAGDRGGNVFLFVGDETGQPGVPESGNNESGIPTAIHVYKWHLEDEGFIYSVDISSDGSYIAAGGKKSIYLLDKKTFVSQNEHDTKDGCVWYFGNAAAEVVGISISDGGEYLAGNTDRTSGGGGMLYAFGRGSNRPVIDFAFSSLNTASSKISGDGKYVALGTNDRVYEFSTAGGNAPLWSCAIAGDQTVVDISGDGQYLYAHKGRIPGQRSGWYDRSYLYDRDYFLREPHMQNRPFTVYNPTSSKPATAWASMSEHGDILVFFDADASGRDVLRVEKPKPKMLMDLVDDRFLLERFYSPGDEQTIRFFFTNPQDTVSNAGLNGVIYLPQYQMFETLIALANEAKEGNRYETVEEVFATIATDIPTSEEVFSGQVSLTAHDNLDKNLTFIIPDLSDKASLRDVDGIPIAAAMTAARLTGRNSSEFAIVDLVGWIYVDGDDPLEPFRGGPPVVNWGPDGAEAGPGPGSQPAASRKDIDLRPESFYLVDQNGGAEYDASNFLSPIRLDVTKTYTIKVGVRNEGPEDFEGPQIKVNLTASPDIGSLDSPLFTVPAGDSRHARYHDLTFEPQAYFFAVKVNPEKSFIENNMNNNIFFGAAEFVEVERPGPPILPIGIDLLPTTITIEGRHLEVPDPLNPPQTPEFQEGNHRLKISVTNGGATTLRAPTLVYVNLEKWDEGINDYARYARQPQLQYAIDVLRGGKEDRKTLPPVSFEAGKYRITVIADPKNLIDEINEENNGLLGEVIFIREIPREPVRGIDLLSEHIILTDAQGIKTNIEGTLEPPQPVGFRPGRYSITAVVKNQGDANLENPTALRMEVDRFDEAQNRFINVDFALFEFDFLGAAGAIERESAPMDFVDGLYRITARADFGNAVEESDEDNNFAGGLARFGEEPPQPPPDGQPDLVPVSFFIGNADATGNNNPERTANQEYDLRIGIENRSDRDFAGVEVAVEVETNPATPPRVSAVDFIGARQRADAVIPRAAYPAARYDFIITVDRVQALAEADDGNNVLNGSATFVEAAPAPGPAVQDAGDVGGGLGGWLRGLIPQWPEAAVTPPPAREWPRIAEEEKEITEGEIVEKEKPLPPAKKTMWPWWVLLALYIYLSLSLHIIAKKTSTSKGWLSWFPIVNFYLMCKIAGKPGWWFWLLLIPLVNIVIGVIVWMGIATVRKKPAWLGGLMLIPLIDLIIPGYLAFSG